MKKIILIFALFVGLLVNAQEQIQVDAFSFITTFSIGDSDYAHIYTHRTGQNPRFDYCYPANATDRDIGFGQDNGEDFLIIEVPHPDGVGFSAREFPYYKVATGGIGGLQIAVFTDQNRIFDITGDAPIELDNLNLIDCSDYSIRVVTTGPSSDRYDNVSFKLKRAGLVDELGFVNGVSTRDFSINFNHHLFEDLFEYDVLIPAGTVGFIDDGFLIFSIEISIHDNSYYGASRTALREGLTVDHPIYTYEEIPGVILIN